MRFHRWPPRNAFPLLGKYRQEAGLPEAGEDTIEVTRTMRAASPPASAADLLDAQNQKPGPAARPFRRVLNRAKILTNLTPSY